MKLTITTREAVIGYAAEYNGGLPFYVPFSSRTRYGVTREQAKRRLEAILKREQDYARRRRASERSDTIELGK